MYNLSNIRVNHTAENNMAKVYVIATGQEISREMMEWLYGVYESDTNYGRVINEVNTYMSELYINNHHDLTTTMSQLVYNITGEKRSDSVVNALIDDYMNNKGIDSWEKLYTYWVSDTTDPIAQALTDAIKEKTILLFSQDTNSTPLIDDHQTTPPVVTPPIITPPSDTTSPIFTSDSIATPINENFGINQIIYIATATDNATITYSLKNTDDFNFLSIDSTTGEVTLIDNPDYETKSSYNFTVVATDSAHNAREKVINLEINNLDESAPTITSGTNATAIAENSGAGQIIYTVTSTDTADIASGATIYSLKNTDDFSFLSIDSSTGEVTLIDNPDYETKSSYNFTVVATDQASNASEQSVILDINNLDESAPTITSGNTAFIQENMPISTLTYQVVSDDSGDISGDVNYNLGGVDAALLNINSTTGEVRLNTSADYETKSNYSFDVIADDGVNLGVAKSIMLSILNQDESAPTITSGTNATAIAENSGAGQIIYTVTSTDTADIASGATIYSLKNTDDFSFLSIDSSTGEVTLIDNPDYETKSSYNFTVVATDQASNASEQSILPLKNWTAV